MNLIDRRTFLEQVAKWGLGASMAGGLVSGLGLKSWKDRGVSLKSVRRSSLVMGSVIEFQVIAETESDGYEAIRRAVALFRVLDQKLSMYDPESEMGRLARQAGKKPVPLSQDALNVLRHAIMIWKRTGGLFDVTVEPAMRAWGFRKDPREPVRQPTDEELRRLERLIGTNKLELTSRRAYLERKGMAVDLGGIAGGYALDRAIDLLRKADLAAGFINFAGDIHCFGTPPDRDGWPVHILNPHTLRPLERPVWLRDEALSTSGSYQNRRESAPERSWGHLLLPGSASPVSTTGSLTAIHSSALQADAWSTAGFVGAERSDELKWIEL